jgi:hypothetical protein
MKIFSDDEDLNINRWQELEHTNPHYLAKLLEQRSAEIMPKIYQESFRKGISVSYCDHDYNNELVEEFPDGRRFILKVTFDEKLKKFVKEFVKEIPKRLNK